jgi:hypothetical protein
VESEHEAARRAAEDAVVAAARLKAEEEMVSEERARATGWGCGALTRLHLFMMKNQKNVFLLMMKNVGLIFSEITH